MADFVYPARNLPGLAEDWGRAVEARDKILDRDFTQLSQSVNNGQRATGGQLAVIAGQIDQIQAQQAELLSRAFEGSSVSPLTVTTVPPASPPGSVNWNSGSVSFSFSPPSERRYGLLNLSGSVAGSVAGGSSAVQGFLMCKRSGVLLANTQITYPTYSYYPSGWGVAFNMTAFTTVAPGTSSFQLELHVPAYANGGTITVNLSSVTAGLIIGSRT